MIKAVPSIVVTMIMAFCFVVGLFLGGRLRDAIWREKAENGFRMESKGRLYRVTHDV
jgi:hypothetical protein